MTLNKKFRVFREMRDMGYGAEPVEVEAPDLKTAYEIAKAAPVPQEALDHIGWQVHS